MHITDILDKEFVIAELGARDKKSVLEELVSIMVEHGRLRDKEKTVEVLLERERLGSTGIGDGIAIPHGKLKEIKSIICSFGRTRAGIDFQSIDDSASEHLQALARLSRLLKDDRTRKRLLEADSKEDIYRIITEEDAHYPSP
jgi:PTS system nitrogen regulatory IIA component